MRHTFLSTACPHLPFAADFFGKNDPYCILLLQASLTTRMKWRSKTHQEGGKTPKWNETHKFDIIEGDDRIQLQVSEQSHRSCSGFV